MPPNLMRRSRVILALYFLAPSAVPCDAFSATPPLAASLNDSPGTLSLLSPGAFERIARGGVHIEKNFLPPELTRALRADARYLFEKGEFQPDGLTNTARTRSEQGFTTRGDRQTFRGGAGWNSDVGDVKARADFDSLMSRLRSELAKELGRPTLRADGSLRHEMTYNWYEPGAKLGRHLDEHHEETKGVKGWQLPTRRSVTWLVYLNNDWREEEGGALRCFPRADESLSSCQVGTHEGNLQVGWLDGTDPVFLDSFRPSGMSGLYRIISMDRGTGQRKERSRRSKIVGKPVQLVSAADFDVPRQPIDFSAFLSPEFQASFEQISTPRLDPRFAAKDVVAPKVNLSAAVEGRGKVLDVVPEGGTLVVFDSVSLPHLVQEVTGKRQRIAATGWFHEDSQFHIGQVMAS